MKAYAILDGGGVKGAALAGALKAAEEREIEFIGYGGTSAGALVAALAAVGYTADELETILVNDSFALFLDDGNGALLKELKSFSTKLGAAATQGWLWFRPWNASKHLVAHRNLIGRLRQDRGLYAGNRLRQNLLNWICAKKPNLKGARDISFDDLQRNGALPLKIVASDITLRRAVVYSAASHGSYSVLDAVRASTCFPLAFCPVDVGSKTLVDGGLASNLPVFLFSNESQERRVPVIAIDLVTDEHGVARPVADLPELLKAMIDTALEASDELLRGREKNLYHFPIRLDPKLSAMDFDLNQQERKALFIKGHSDFHSLYKPVFETIDQERQRRIDAISTQVPTILAQQLRRETDLQVRLQSLYCSPLLVNPILYHLREWVQAQTPAREVRVHIMLPTLRDTRVVVYQVGMEGFPDRTLELVIDAGCSGLAFASKKPVAADLTLAWQQLSAWKMTVEQQERIPTDRASMLSLPIFDTSALPLDRETVDLNLLPVIGTLSLDSVTPLFETSWMIKSAQGEVMNSEVVGFLRTWADILGKLLS